MDVERLTAWRFCSQALKNLRHNITDQRLSHSHCQSTSTSPLRRKPLTQSMMLKEDSERKREGSSPLSGRPSSAELAALLAMQGSQQLGSTHPSLTHDTTDWTSPQKKKHSSRSTAYRFSRSLVHKNIQVSGVSAYQLLSLILFEVLRL